MSDKMYCYKCGTPFDPDTDLFCSNCGLQFSGGASSAQKKAILRELEDIEREPKPYEALRIASGFIVFFGWLVIIFGWMFAFTVSVYYKDTFSDAGPYLLPRGFPLVAVLGILSTIQGLFMIAAGQVFMVLLDLRNDTHILKESYLLLGAAMLDQNKPADKK